MQYFAKQDIIDQSTGCALIRAGDQIYICRKPDYGVARDEERITGKAHQSVTLDENGGYPFITIPCEYIEARGDTVKPTDPFSYYLRRNAQ